jgi:hypothetical protein
MVEPLVSALHPSTPIVVNGMNICIKEKWNRPDHMAGDSACCQTAFNTVVDRVATGDGTCIDGEGGDGCYEGWDDFEEGTLRREGA